MVERTSADITIKWFDATANEIKTRAVVPITASSKRVKNLMGDDYVQLEFMSADAIVFNIGDYIEDEIFGKFVLRTRQMPSDERTVGGYKYSLRFDAWYMMWENKNCMMVTKITKTDNGVVSIDKIERTETQWYLTDTLENQAQAVLDNLIALGYTDSTKGKINVIRCEKRGEVKSMTYSNTKIVSALKNLADTWETEWWIEGDEKDFTIYFGKCEDRITRETTVERDNNVEIMNISKNSNTYANKIFVYGSKDNVPFSYRKKLVLHTDCSQAETENAQGYSSQIKYFSLDRKITADMFPKNDSEYAKTELNVKGGQIYEEYAPDYHSPYYIIRKLTAKSKTIKLGMGTYNFIPIDNFLKRVHYSEKGDISDIVNNDEIRLASINLKYNYDGSKDNARSKAKGRAIKLILKGYYQITLVNDKNEEVVISNGTTTWRSESFNFIDEHKAYYGIMLVEYIPSLDNYINNQLLKKEEVILKFDKIPNFVGGVNSNDRTWHYKYETWIDYDLEYSDGTDASKIKNEITLSYSLHTYETCKSLGELHLSMQVGRIKNEQIGVVKIYENSEKDFADRKYLYMRLNPFNVIKGVGADYDKFYQVAFMDEDSIKESKEENRYLTHSEMTWYGGWRLDIVKEFVLGESYNKVPSAYYVDDTNDPTALMRIGEARLRLPRKEQDSDDGLWTCKDGFILPKAYTNDINSPNLIEEAVVFEKVYPSCILKIKDGVEDSGAIVKEQIDTVQEWDGEAFTHTWKGTQYHIRLAQFSNGASFPFKEEYRLNDTKLELRFLSHEDVDISSLSYPNNCKMSGMTFETAYNSSINYLEEGTIVDTDALAELATKKKEWEDKLEGTENDNGLRKELTQAENDYTNNSTEENKAKIEDVQKAIKEAEDEITKLEEEMLEITKKSYKNHTDEFIVIRNSDFGTTLPNETIRPNYGDPLTLIGWDVNAMSTLGLLEDAENRLMKKGFEYAKALEEEQFTFDCTMKSTFFFDLAKRHTKFLKDKDGKIIAVKDVEFNRNVTVREYEDNVYEIPNLGERVLIKHGSLISDKHSRIIGMEMKFDKPYDSPKIKVGETDAYSRLKQIEKQITRLS